MKTESPWLIVNIDNDVTKAILVEKGDGRYLVKGKGETLPLNKGEVEGVSGLTPQTVPALAPSPFSDCARRHVTRPGRVPDCPAPWSGPAALR